MPRFVILEHDHPILHWDLMLEGDGVLQTWRLAHAPEPLAGAIEATALADHRVMYLDYEGPISGNRGNVKRWDAGEYIEEAGSAAEARSLFLKGARLCTRVLLMRISEGSWRLRFLPSESRC